jgi:hypothetical protein
MNMSVAFKCKLNDEQEFMLGQAMLRHESLIDRSYLSLADKRNWRLGYSQKATQEERKTRYASVVLRLHLWP